MKISGHTLFAPDFGKKLKYFQLNIIPVNYYQFIRLKKILLSSNTVINETECNLIIL